MGKTNLAKTIVSEMVKQKLPCQHKIFDTAQVWRHNFVSEFKLQEINDSTSKIYDESDNVVFDIEYVDSEKIMQFMGNCVYLDYTNNRERKKAANGILNDWIVYTLEEAQNSLGRYSLSRNTGKFWLKAISEGANFNLAYLFIGQRAADISAQAVERAQTYFIGRTTGENNTRKLIGIIGRDTGAIQLGEPLYQVAKKLEKGEFLFWNGATAWKFKCPKFEELYPNQKPQLVSPPKQRWMKIF
jgi:hypothetical protein